MAHVVVTPKQLLADPVLCRRLVGSSVQIKVNTRIGMVAGHFLRQDPAHGRAVTLVVRDGQTGRDYLLFLYTAIITEMAFYQEDRLPDEEIRLHYQNKQTITA